MNQASSSGARARQANRPEACGVGAGQGAGDEAAPPLGVGCASEASGWVHPPATSGLQGASLAVEGPGC